MSYSQLQRYHGTANTTLGQLNTIQITFKLYILPIIFNFFSPKHTYKIRSLALDTCIRQNTLTIFVEHLSIQKIFVEFLTILVRF